MNDRGAVVGRSSLAGEAGIHAFKYQDGTIQDLGTLGGTFSVATSINNHGIVVGASWDEAGGWASLVPTAINDRGWITGWGSRPGQSGKAFLLIPR